MKVRARLLVSRHVHDSKSHSVRNRGSMPSTSLTVHNVLNDNNVLSCLINVTIVAQDSKNGNCG